MNTITNFRSTIGDTILDFMDRAPGLISSILTVVIVVGFWFLG